jgi:hypothetical protein
MTVQAKLFNSHKKYGKTSDLSPKGRSPIYYALLSDGKTGPPAARGGILSNRLGSQ